MVDRQAQRGSVNRVCDDRLDAGGIADGDEAGDQGGSSGADHRYHFENPCQQGQKDRVGDMENNSEADIRGRYRVRDDNEDADKVAFQDRV